MLTCNEAYNAKVQAKEQKEQQEIEKAERQRKREEKAKNGKKEKQKKMEARGKPDTQTWECFICTLPWADGDEDFNPMVFCNGCGRWLHIGCIPKSHSMPISDDENE